jgi:DNA-binding beta-propeller fold protein YncE
MARARSLALFLTALSLTACGGGGSDSPSARPLGSLTDSDSAPELLRENARAGATVGITVAAPELSARGAVAFTLANNSTGAFAIGRDTGIITLIGAVDYEAAARRTVTARATSADGQYFAERDFTIDVTDSPAPAVEIDFPFTHANYAHTNAGVSGRVIHPDPSSISVRASAGAATSEGVVAPDGRFFVRSVTVPDGSELRLTVTASHAGDESGSKTISLGRAPDLTAVEAMVVDSARDRYLLADRYSGTIVAIARNGYARSLVSGGGRGSGVPFDEPFDLALDASGDRLYVLDGELRAVFLVDLRSGDRTLISRDSTLSPGVGTGRQLLRPTALVFEPTRGLLFVADDGYDVLVAIDPATGNRTTVSDNTPAYGATMNFWDSLALDAARNRLITATVSLDDLYGIDLTTGARSLISDRPRDLSTENRSFEDVAIAPARDAAYLTDSFSNAVVRVDLATGARTSISSSGLMAATITHPVIGTGQELEWPTDVTYDETHDRVLIFEEGFADPLVEIDEATGNRTQLTNGAVGGGINFKDPAGIVLDAAGSTAYVVDSIADIVVAVNLQDGSRRLIAGSPTGRGTIATTPLAIDLDAAGGELYIVDFTLNSLYALNIATGAQRTISDQTTGSGPLLGNPVDVAIDLNARVAYVIDSQLDTLFAIELASGLRRAVATGLDRATGLALAPNGVAYVAVNGSEVSRVDLATGQKAVVSGSGPRPGSIGDIAFDARYGRVIALDVFPPRLIAIDVAAGNRTEVSGANLGGGPVAKQPRGIHVDASRQVAYLTENLYDAVIAVDLLSGYRQVVAR